MNCVLFAKMDQIFSLKNKTLKIGENTGKVREFCQFVSPDAGTPPPSPAGPEADPTPPPPPPADTPLRPCAVHAGIRSTSGR